MLLIKFLIYIIIVEVYANGRFGLNPRARVRKGGAKELHQRTMERLMNICATSLMDGPFQPLTESQVSANNSKSLGSRRCLEFPGSGLKFEINLGFGIYF